MATEKIRKIEGTLYRSATFDRKTIDVENRTVEVAFSSEEPVTRYWGVEILDHSEKSVDLSRMNNGGAVLVDHNSTIQVGVNDKAWVDTKTKKGRALARFGKSTRAEQEWQDVQDGIRQHVSVGYMVNEMQLESSKDGLDTYRVTNWTPFEISFVSIPADTTVGVGRSLEEQGLKVIFEKSEDQRTMTVEQTTTTTTGNPATVANPAENARALQEAAQAAANAARTDELSRIREINAIGEKFDLRELATQFINEGKTADDFRKAVLDGQGKPTVIRVPDNASDIGMSDKEIKRYSLLRAIRADMEAKRGNVDAWKNAGLEREASEAIAKKLGQAARGFFMPSDVLMAQRSFTGAVEIAQAIQKRGLNVGTSTAGGNLVATNLLAANFIDLLRDAMVVLGLGVQTLTGLEGNIAIPRQTGAATAYWVAENGNLTTSAQAFDQVSMSPKTVGAYTDISRSLILQSSIDVENFVLMDLAAQLARAIQTAIINGSGSSNQPLGILGISGIGSVVGGTNGAAPTWSHIVNLETSVAQANAEFGSLAYLTNAKVRGTLKQALKASAAGATFIWEDGQMNDYKAEMTNAVPSTLTKGSSSGNCSALIFGNWADAILGLWGGLDVLVDPFTNGINGAVRIINFQSCDFNVRHPQSFAAMTDALTST